jgi:hypothetical protein
MRYPKVGAAEPTEWTDDPQQISTGTLVEALLSLFTRVNSVLAGRSVRTDIANPAAGLSINAPAMTDGSTIWFSNFALKDIFAVDVLARGGGAFSTRRSHEEILSRLAWFRGLNYHELAHVLYSPRINGKLWKRIEAHSHTSRHNAIAGTVDIKYVRTAFNLLEDQRIETLFVAKFPQSHHWFAAAVAKYITAACSGTTSSDIQESVNAQNNKIAANYLLVYGRKFLPKSLRKSLRDAFVAKFILSPTLAAKFSHKDLARAEELIGKYRRLTLAPKQHSEATAIVVEFAKLMEKLDPHQGFVPENPTGPHGNWTQGKRDGDSRDAEDQQPAIDDSDAEDEKEDGESGGGVGSDDSDDDEDTEGDGVGAGEDSDDDEDADEDGEGDGDGDADDETDSDQSQSGRRHTDSNDDKKQGSSQESNSSPYDDAYDQAKDLLKSAKDEMLKDAKSTLNSVNAVAEKISDERFWRNRLNDNGKRGTSANERVLATNLSSALQRLRADTDNQWERGSFVGRLNALKHATSRGLSTDFFDEWVDDGDDRPDAEVVILLDRSSSMDSYIPTQFDPKSGIANAWGTVMSEACAAMWAIKYACQTQDIPCSVIGYNNAATPLYSSDEKVGLGQFALFEGKGGTHPTTALSIALRMLAKSEAKHKLLFSITDGQWTIDGDLCKAVYNATRSGGASSFLIQLPESYSHANKWQYSNFHQSPHNPHEPWRTNCGHAHLVQAPNCREIAKVIGREVIRAVAMRQ